MSGSPKYNSVALAAARRAQAEAERAARARRREEKRQRRLAAALQRTRRTAERRCASLASRYATLRAPAEAVGLGPDAATRTAAVEQIATQIVGATNHAELAVADRQLDRLEWQIDSLADAVGLRRVAEVSVGLKQLARQLEAIPRGERLQLDAPGGQAAENALRAATSSPGTQSREQLSSVGRKVTEHLERVRSAQAERAAAVRNAQAQIDDLGSRLEMLRADGRDLQIRLEGAEFAQDHLDRMRGLASGGHLDELSVTLPQVVETINRVEQSFDLTVDRVVERRRILGSIIAGLPGLGFGVIADSLTELPDGSVSLRAETLRGETLDVLVHDGENDPHEVLYAGSELESEEAAGGITGSTCGSLVELVGALNESVARDGYVTGAVQWDDGGPGPDTDGTGLTLPSIGPSVHGAR
ncbi:hypothetical protein EV649_5056 [Kribbella sp. VKM Ac-2569]|uniref:hypothetical protein n=1 Tax=Kribbella sp. VKM Ac-2569 TaxID=2512220 RepID=UPI00102B14A5|nr:hypothetical protein [Kribbella sp. VKM Ac-2569]RZT17509.1 hypothetical protein EV649_5056 [Kribbella sp. VKM Ac-2569]